MIYENPNFVSPNVVRAMRKSDKMNKYVNRVASVEARKFREQLNQPEPDELDFVFKDMEENENEKEEAEEDGGEGEEEGSGEEGSGDEEGSGGDEGSGDDMDDSDE